MTSNNRLLWPLLKQWLLFQYRGLIKSPSFVCLCTVLSDGDGMRSVSYWEVRLRSLRRCSQADLVTSQSPAAGQGIKLKSNTWITFYVTDGTVTSSSSTSERSSSSSTFRTAPRWEWKRVTLALLTALQQHRRIIDKAPSYSYPILVYFRLCREMKYIPWFSRPDLHYNRFSEYKGSEVSSPLVCEEVQSYRNNC